MLTPKELESLPQSVTELYEQLEEDIIADMARRIVKTDFATDTAQWQLIQLQRMSVTHDEVFKKLSKLTNKTEKELVKLFNNAAQKSFDRDSDIYSRAGYETIPLSENKQLQKIIAAGLEKTNGLFENLTKTTANTASRQFENALDRAYMQVVSGAFDYNTAVRTAIKDLAQKGIASITYPGGHTDYLDVAVRRAVLTGVSQTTGKMQEQMADDAGCDLVETTAHNGARPDHAQWQGKVFSRSGTSKKYPDFKSSTGYGTGAGLKGWNCRHDFFPYFEDMPNAYSEEKLQWLNNREVEYNGVKMTEYEASQKQRAMERRIRASKRELAGYDAGIKASDSESLKEELQKAFNKKSVVLKKQEADLKDFCNQTGLRRDRAREQVSAHFDSDKGKTVAFDKSVSQKAVWADKKESKTVEKTLKNDKIQIEKRILKQDEVIEKAKVFADELLSNPDLLRNDNGYSIGSYVSRRLEYDKLPKVVSAQEFEELSKGKGVLYRGVTDYKNVTAHEMTEQFKKGKFFCGRGIYGNGTYVDVDKKIAEYYAYNSGNTHKGEIMEMLLDESAKIADFKSIFKEFEKTGIPKIIGVPKEAYQEVIRDVGTYAAIKGYDAIALNGFQNKNHFVILNRGKVIIKE